MLQITGKTPWFSLGLILCSIIATFTYSHVLATGAMAIYDSPGPVLFAGLITSSAGALLSFFYFNNRWRNGFNALLVAGALSAAGMYLPAKMLMEKRLDALQHLITSRVSAQFIINRFETIDTNSNGEISDVELDVAVGLSTDANAIFSINYIKGNFILVGHPADPSYTPSYRWVGKIRIPVRNPADYVISREDLESFPVETAERYKNWRTQ